VLSVPDPESESNRKTITVKSEFVEPEQVEPVLGKRKFANHDDPDSDKTPFSNLNPKALAKSPKKAFSNRQLTNPQSNSLVPTISGSTWFTKAGCRWSDVNWSCAYDSVFMSLYGIYVTARFQFCQDFSSASLLANTLDHSFKSLLESPLCTTAMFDHHRDKLCDELSCRYLDQLRHLGHHRASVSAILDVLFPLTGCQLMINPRCDNGCTISINLMAYSAS
jgi:hypothetical protein